jgi:hypothetical protein
VARRATPTAAPQAASEVANSTPSDHQGG